MRWREGNGLPHISSARPPVGTTFSFTLDRSATVHLAFTQTATGRRVGRRCVAPTAHNRSKRACKRTVTVATLSFAGHAGVNHVRFQGRVNHRTKLRPGRYTLLIIAIAGGHASPPAKLSFTIVKG